MLTYDPSAYRAYFEREFTYLAGFRRSTHRFARRTALTDPATGGRWTYAELGARVDALAAGLAGAGVVAYRLCNAPSSPSSTWRRRPRASWKIHHKAAAQAAEDDAQGLFDHV